MAEPTNADKTSFEIYKSWDSRPYGMPFYNLNEAGQIIVVPGELFCRYDMSLDEEGLKDGDNRDRLCCNKTKFSSTGNLRAHLKTHGRRAEPSSPGKLSQKMKTEMAGDGSCGDEKCAGSGTGCTRTRFQDGQASAQNFQSACWIKPECEYLTMFMAVAETTILKDKETAGKKNSEDEKDEEEVEGGKYLGFR